MSDAGSLYDVAAELLAKSAAILAALPAGAPTNQLVTHGPPAYDCCNTLFVHVGAFVYDSLRRQPEGAAAGSMRDPRMPVLLVVPLTVTALRCVSRQALPSGGLAIRNADLAAIRADAETVYADGWSLFNGLHNAYKDGTLFEGFPCRVSEVGAAIPIAPEGGCLGWQVVVTVTLDGFKP